MSPSVPAVVTPGEQPSPVGSRVNATMASGRAAINKRWRENEKIRKVQAQITTGEAPVGMPESIRLVKNSKFTKNTFETLEITDTFRAFRLANEYIVEGSAPVWSKLSGGDQLLEKDYSKLRGSQNLLYFRLLALLRLYVQRTIGPSKFNDVRTLFVWNWET